MYEEHILCRKPEKQDARIWRYMSFSKFVDLLDKRSLFFARIDNLGDPFEGAFFRCHYGALGKVELPSQGDLAKTQQLAALWRKTVAVSCWHLNDYESAAMWSHYRNIHDGIAIASTFNRLTSSFDAVQERVYVGTVTYIDYESESIDGTKFFNVFLHKRKSFEHERELRAFIWRGTDLIEESGIHVPVDLAKLVEAVYVSPQAPEWVRGLAESVVRKYGLLAEVIRSKLDDKPLF